MRRRRRLWMNSSHSVSSFYGGPRLRLPYLSSSFAYFKSWSRCTMSGKSFVNLRKNYSRRSNSRRLFLPFQILMTEKDKAKLASTEKRKAADQEAEPLKDLKKVISCKFSYKKLFEHVYHTKLNLSTGETGNKSFKSQKTRIHRW